MSPRVVSDLDDTVEDVYRWLKRLKTQVDGTPAPHRLLSTTHTDTSPATPVDGDIITVQSSLWSRLPVGTAGQLLKIVGGTPAWDSDAHNILSARHDATVASAVNGDIITRQAGAWARLAVGSNGQVLVVSGGAPAWGADAHNLLSTRHGDTTAASPTNGDIIVAQAGAWARFAIGSNDRVLAVSGGAPTWTQIVDAHVSGSAAIAWSKIDKTGSSLADLATRSAGDLSSGTLDDARLSSNVPLKNATNIFTAAQEISHASIPRLRLRNTGEAADNEYICITNEGGFLAFSAFTDDLGTEDELFRVDRSDGFVSFTGEIYERARAVAMGEWQDYTPVWTGTSTNPTLGNGTLAGRWTYVAGKTVCFEISLTIGSTTTVATGIWTFTLPVAKRNDAFLRCIIGPALAENTGVADFPGGALTATTTTVVVLIDSTGAVVTEAAPFTWGNTDLLTIFGTYEEA